MRADQIDTSKMDLVEFKNYSEIQKIQGDLWDKMDELKGCGYDDARKSRLNIEIRELAHKYVTTNM